MKEALQKIAEYFDFLKVLDALGVTFLGNAPSRWMIALIVSVLAMVSLRFAHRLAESRLQKLAAKTDNYLDDIVVETISRTKSWFLVVLGLYVGSLLLELGTHGTSMRHVLMVAAFIQLGLWSGSLLSSALRQWHASRNGEASIGTAMVAFRFLGHVMIWSVVLLLMLDNLGVKVVSLLAGLGVGGIAIALAVQRVLGDLLASVSIILDKPFEIGDAINLGDATGVVEHVGLKSTRLRSLSGEQLIVSNSDLLNTRIRNFKRMQERRNLWTFGVTYQTSPDKLAQIPVWVKEIVSAQPILRFERAHFQKLGDSALVFEVVHWVTSPDYNLYMDAQQAVNLALVSKFAGEGVEFAYPTQTVFLQKN